MSQRFTITASSLGNYFGVGFIPPMEQLAIDLGEKERVVFANVQDRMDLGVEMEGPILNYWEKKLGVEIVDRNTEVFTVLDGLIRCKVDGRTIYDGVPTVVEAKYTTGTSSFVSDKGYLLQTHAYLLDGGEQVLLLGAFNGKPDIKLIKREESIIEDITEMAYAVSGILNGLLTKDDFPWHLVEKWSGSGELPDLSESVYDMDSIYRYMEINEKIKELQKEQDEIAEFLKAHYETGEISTERGKLSISTGSRKGSIDEQALRVAFPDIDFDKFRKPDSTYKTIRIGKVKSKA